MSVKLRIIKILTIISYFFIMFHGEHVGGPLIILLILGVLVPEPYLLIKTIIVWLAIGDYYVDYKTCAKKGHNLDPLLLCGDDNFYYMDGRSEKIYLPMRKS